MLDVEEAIAEEVSASIEPAPSAFFIFFFFCLVASLAGCFIGGFHDGLTPVAPVAACRAALVEGGSAGGCLLRGGGSRQGLKSGAPGS